MPAHNIWNHYVYHKQVNKKYIDDRNVMPVEEKGLKGQKNAKINY